MSPADASPSADLDVDVIELLFSALARAPLVAATLGVAQLCARASALLRVLRLLPAPAERAACLLKAAAAGCRLAGLTGAPTSRDGLFTAAVLLLPAAACRHLDSLLRERRGLQPAVLAAFSLVLNVAVAFETANGSPPPPPICCCVAPRALLVLRLEGGVDSVGHAELLRAVVGRAALNAGLAVAGVRVPADSEVALARACASLAAAAAAAELNAPAPLLYGAGRRGR